MKADVKRIMKESGTIHLYTDFKLGVMKDLMKAHRKQDPGLDCILGLDPLNRAQWIADNMPKLQKVVHTQD